MSTVTAYVVVSRGWTHNESVLWTREFEMDFLPAEGDRVLYLASEEEPDGSVNGYVKRRYWDIDGASSIEFQNVIVDPDERNAPRTPHRNDTYWWTDRDGSVEDYLVRSGWSKRS